MPRKQTPTPPPTETPGSRSVVLPDNPFRLADATWSEALLGSIVSDLQDAIQQTERKLGDAWEQGARMGYDLGFQAGAKETEAELRAFYEEALTEQETKAARDLADLERRLVAEHDAELRTLREANRRELERLSTEQEARLANLEDAVRRETELELQHRFSAELSAVEARVRHDTEQAVRAALASERSAEPGSEDTEAKVREARAEGYTQGLNESARRYEEAMTRAAMERREAVEDAYRKGFDEAGSQTEKELKASYREGYRQGLQEAGQGFASAAGGAVPSPLLDEARRQAYENGYEDGRGVGLARGKRQAEAEQMARLHEATRVAYREGFLDGKRTVADAERSWAFGVLHLPPDATASEVKQHYKRLSMALHPDQNPQLADVFIKNLNHAKQLLDT